MLDYVNLTFIDKEKYVLCLLLSLKVVVNFNLLFVPIGKPIIRLTYRYCEYLLNMHCLGEIYCICTQ